jgi:SAM hydroxide adenosyltransferase N-terminal domain
MRDRCKARAHSGKLMEPSSATNKLQHGCAVHGFGLQGPYTGQMKAVLHHMAPGIPAIDLFADAPLGNPKASACLLAAYAEWFAAGIVFLCVVDPGVGGTRPPIILEADGRRRMFRPWPLALLCGGAAGRTVWHGERARRLGNGTSRLRTRHRRVDDAIASTGSAPREPGWSPFIDGNIHPERVAIRPTSHGPSARTSKLRIPQPGPDGVVARHRTF